MRVGFSVFMKDTYNDKSTGVWGDEIMANAFCGQLSKYHDAMVRTFEELLKDNIDVCVHTTVCPFADVKKMADRNILWIQGFTYGRGSHRVMPLDEVYNDAKSKYDLVITSSRKLSQMCNIPFVLPFTGTETYVPKMTDWNYDVTFIGNIIKYPETISRYISPFGGFEYNLFGGDWGKISHEKALQVISGSKINFSFGFEEGIKWDMVIARPFYHSLCQAFTMMDKIPWYMENFKDAMAFTEGCEDEKQKIAYYLENHDERKKMAATAHEIAVSLKNDELLKIIGGV